MKEQPFNHREEALIQLIQSQQRQMYRMAYSYVGNEQDALDVVQEAVYKAILNQEQLIHMSFMKTWLMKILIRCAQDLIEKKGKVLIFAPETLTEQIQRLEHRESKLYEESDYIDLKEAISGLELRQRQILELRFFEDFKLEEIAEMLCMPLGTVKSTLYRTLKTLRLELEGVEACE